MNKTSFRAALRTSTALVGIAFAGLATAPANAVVINANYTPSQIVDTTNVTGVGQMVVDEKNGFIGLCTATLINPRTVIFASHCVNENPSGTGFMPSTGYGAASGGLPIAFFFNANNNQSGNSAIGQWLNGVSGGAKYLTRTSNNAYNSNYVVYNTQSTALGLGNNFLQADIAMAALDTPAVGIPTWTLLFSPLTSSTHATITGYGNNGVGANGGSGGIDFRRRSAENIISVLGSLDDQDTFLFGGPDGLPQNLYMVDFNDPKFGTAQANAYDFNIFHDAAQTKEGITAPGDSGGPLIVDQLYNKSVIAGVLSGGDRFYYSQKSSAYGTTSFYQPLYLYWDWIIANNPYKYVSAKAGDGSWTDPTHWVMNLDPNYVTASGTTLTNALPTTAAQGVPASGSVNSPKFGLVCYYTDCVNIATGVETYPTPYSGDSQSTGSNLESSPAQVAVSDILGSDAGTVSSDAATTPQLDGSLLSSSTTPAEGSALVDGVLIQGAPGSSNFVPKDTDGNALTGAPARYYDVTLSASGTTTLSGTSITIDRLTINGASTGLTIASDASLTTLIDTTVYAGNFRVNGIYTSAGDIALLGGNLSGTGLVNAPNTTAVLGAFVPGTAGTIGTLTVNGNVILSSGSGVLADVSSTASDLLDVYGTASLGGTLVVNPVGGYVPKYHDQKSVLYADTIVGSFDHVPDTIAGVLYPTVTTVTVGSGPSAYQAEIVTFEAATFSSLTGLNDDQMQIAKLLDGDRGAHYNDLQALYDAIDPLYGAPLGAALENLVPHAARTAAQVTGLLNDAYSSSLWNYIGGLSHNGDAHIALNTSTLKLTQNSTVGSYEMRSMLTNLGAKDAGIVSALGAVSPNEAEGGMKLPKGWGGFLTGQAIDGYVDAGGSTGKANVSGWLVAVGLDLPASEHFRAGLSIALGEAQAKVRSQPAITETATKQATFYGQWDSSHGFFVNGFVGASVQAISTERDIVIGSSTFHVNGHASGTSAMYGMQIGTIIDGVLEGQIRPAAGFQYARPDIAGYTTYIGTTPAESILPYSKEELDLRIGFDANWKIDVHGTTIRPDLHLFLVDAAQSRSSGIQSLLAAAPGSPYTFSVATPSSTWFETGLGAQVDLCDYASLGFHFNANPGRADANYQSYSGSLKINF